MRQLKQCIDALRKGGLTVYTPASHDGVCASPYCVVQYLGSVLHSSAGTGIDMLRIHIYAPIGRFFLIEEMREKTEKAMRPLIESGAVRPCESVGACVVDDTFKAHSCYLDYRVQFGMNT